MSLNNSHQSFKYVASLISDNDLMPDPSYKVGVHSLCQATITSFLLLMSPLQIKFIIHLSYFLIKLEGQV